MDSTMNKVTSEGFVWLYAVKGSKMYVKLIIIELICGPKQKWAWSICELIGCID